MGLLITCFKTTKSQPKKRLSKCNERRKRMRHSKKGDRSKKGVKGLKNKTIIIKDAMGKERLINRIKDLRLISDQSNRSLCQKLRRMTLVSNRNPNSTMFIKVQEEDVVLNLMCKKKTEWTGEITLSRGEEGMVEVKIIDKREISISQEVGVATIMTDLKLQIVEAKDVVKIDPSTRVIEVMKDHRIKAIEEETRSTLAVVGVTTKLIQMGKEGVKLVTVEATEETEAQIIHLPEVATGKISRGKLSIKTGITQQKILLSKVPTKMAATVMRK